MATMNISLPEPLKQFVDEEVREGGFAGTSDYVRDLIRQRQRAKSAEFQRQLIAEGLASGSAGEMTAETVEQIRKDLRKRHARDAR
ncbi:MAG TPA: type II toxin-antitoxin system ParD family antitoxin [Chiayiivirga sp.]|nr:type II toxin-antitoxin system ParD family antitoxin [Chiayiivirga sp.]